MTRAALAVALLLAVVASPVAGVVAPVAAATPDGSSETAAASQADAVRITGFAAPDEAARGERISVTATVENTGDREANVTVTYRIDGVGRASAARTLAPGETATVRLHATVQRSLAPGTYDQGVFVGDTDRGQIADLDVVPTSSAVVAISGFQGPTEANTGTDVTASATVENAGTADGTVVLEYRIGGEVVATREVPLAAGTTVTVAFRATVPDLGPGTYRQGIYRQGTDAGSTARLVVDPSPIRFELLSFHGPGETRSGRSVRATATVRNAGDGRVTETFEYRIGGEVVDSLTVTLPVGGAATLEFQGTVPNLPAGTYQQGVFRSGATAGLTRSIELTMTEPSFSMSSLRAPSRALVDQRMSASVIVENRGNARGSTTLQYRVAGTTVDTERVALFAGERRRVTLEGPVPDRPTGTYDQEVFFENSDRGLAARVTIEQEADESRAILLSNLEAPTEANRGDEITVRATVRNAGTRTERVTVEYRIGSRVIDDARVELHPGRARRVQFDVTVPDLRDGVYRQGVFVADADRGQTTSLQISDPPRFRVSNFRGPSSVRVGDRIAAQGRIDNTGDRRATATVTYRIGSRVIAEEDVTLNGGVHRQITLEGTVPSIAPGTYRQQLSTETSASTRSIEVRRQSRPRPVFRISSFDGPTEARAGSSVSATAVVRNTGNESGTVTIDHRIGGRILSSRQVTLDPGERRTLSFNGTVPDLEAGVHPHGAFVSGTSEGASGPLLVRPGTPRFSVSNVRAPAAAAPGDRITVEATVTNTGTVAGRTTAVYRLDGERRASTSVELNAGAETTVRFEVTVPELDPGSYSHGVFVDDTDRGGTTSLTVEAAETPTPTPTPSPSPTPFPTPTPSPSPTPSPTPTGTTTTDSPGFGLSAALAALAALAVLSVRLAATRRRRR